MQYATLEEAYPNYYSPSQTISKKSSTKKKVNEPFINDYGIESDCYYKKQGIDMPNCERFNNSNTNSNNTNITNNSNNSNTNSNTNTNSNNSNTNSNNTNNNTNTKDSDNDSYASYASMVKNDCSPIQPPVYTLPIDSNSKKAFNKAIETSLNTNINETNKPDKFSIKPFDYDEYDAYLNIHDVNTNNKDATVEYRTTPFLEEYLKTLRDNFKSPIVEQGLKLNDIEQFTNYNSNIKVDVNLYNLFLFIFIGIIIILLCEQITRLAIILANKNI
jgi:hypothetical protein